MASPICYGLLTCFFVKRRSGCMPITYPFFSFISLSVSALFDGLETKLFGAEVMHFRGSYSYLVGSRLSVTVIEDDFSSFSN